jgi:N-acetyl-1-D-myo-inositol-2-amino-2-deoxy-alpha-D-glucopyranoside deacetylase
VTTGSSQAQRRLLLVHAHPDDESINHGATMARYVAAGVQVTLVTCTRGELGEVIPQRLAYLAGPDAGPDGLGDYRVGELAAAMTALGVTDHRFLGDPVSPGRTARAAAAGGGTVYRDSGMAYDQNGGVIPAPQQPAGAFAPTGAAGSGAAGPGAAGSDVAGSVTAGSVERPAEQLAALIRELRPQVVLTYEPGGGYGHPDHVQAHRVTMRAVELAALDGPTTPPGSAELGSAEPRASAELPGPAELGSTEPLASAELPGLAEPSALPGWAVPKVYWAAMPESLMRATLSALAAAEGTAYHGLDPAGRMPSEVVPDDQVTAAIDAMNFTAAKVAALRAHETQVSVSADGAFYALSNGIRRPVLGLEFYRLARGVPAGERDDVGRETDLFAGT